MKGSELIAKLNSAPMFVLGGIVIAFIVLLSIVFLVKSYRAGLAVGMEKKALKKAITASATFTVLPSVSILLGVIALGGSLGVPLPWVRLSVIGALHYEGTVADIGARNAGMAGGLSAAEMTGDAFVTIALLMTVGIMWSVILCIILCKWYTKKLAGKPEKAEAVPAEESAKPKKGLGDVMFIAMFIGLVSAYIGSYVGVFTSTGDYMPIAVAVVAGVVMAVCEYLTRKLHWEWLESFSMALSMLVGMSAAIVMGLL